MLNHIWWALIVLSLLAAAGNDAYDELNNTYRNGLPLRISFHSKEVWTGGTKTDGDIVVAGAVLRKFYGIEDRRDQNDTLKQNASLSSDGKAVLVISDSSPIIWQAMAKSSSIKGGLSGHIVSLQFSEDKINAKGVIIFEPIHFTKLRAVTQAAIDFAATAVEIALALIGVMALWLGLMKIAEEAGLVQLLSKVLAPITKKVFPDIPPDHQAIGSIIMNIAANMLGLNNAATPLGLKAMKELNSLNPKPGTATNAMVTFLAINTGGLILIPATAIAVRAASGSANPGIIIGTSMFGALCATVAGVTASKLLQKLPWYKIKSEKEDANSSGR